MNEEWRKWNPQYLTRTEIVYRRARHEDMLCRSHYAHYWQPTPGVWVTRLVGIEELGGDPEEGQIRTADRGLLFRDEIGDISLELQ